MPRFQVHPVKPTRRKRYHNGRLTKSPSRPSSKLKTLPAVVDMSPVAPILDVRGTGAATGAALATAIELTEPSTAPIVFEDQGEAPEPVPIPTVVTCPLCKKLITFNDGIFNVKAIKFNNKDVQVHKVCPE